MIKRDYLPEEEKNGKLIHAHLNTRQWAFVKNRSTNKPSISATIREIIDDAMRYDEYEPVGL